MKELKIVERIKADYGQQMLSCHHEDMMALRMKAQMIDDFLDELERKAHRGELTYGRDTA